MSEPKLISPMLDAFDMGAPISDHDGVRCCPAMRKETADKYIVKVISVPASQTKLDALLLTGAYPNKEAALEYFKELADGIFEEKKVLDELAGLEGFAAYEDCQIVAMEEGTGYDVYLLAPYRMTLERKTARTPLTQLEAVNLGLDLCSALAICRRSGYMYVDVKPQNIVLIGDKEFRIGDLGFLNLGSLQYASLPDKYRSAYTAPEIEDAFSTLNTTLDVYAVGTVLYQIYNGGILPEKTTGDIPAPVYADEEIAQIILKAIAPDPADRWQDPVEMGQALVSYMQKNGVNDTPLTAEYFAEDTAEEDPAPFPEETAPECEVTEEVTADDGEDICAEVPQEAPEEPEAVTEAEEIAQDIPDADKEPEAEEPSSDAEDDDTAEAESSEAEEPLQSVTTDAAEEEDDLVNLSFLDEDGELEVDYDAVSTDVSEMLDQIDELAAHQIPEPPVAPDPIEVKLPDPPAEPEATEEEAESIPSEASDAEADETLTESVPEEKEVLSEEEEDIPEEEKPYVPKKKRTGLVWCIVLLLIIALGVGGYFFYKDYYLQPIHTLTLEGIEDRLQVQLTADIDETYLTVVCADSHGNRIPAPVVGGTAVFTGLAPDTAYTVSVEVDGLHKLTGVTSKVYSTPIQTKIAQISVVTGSESGSVILSFAVEGPDSDQWNVIYSADGEAERVTAFPAHMVTLTGLTVGKEYTFRLEPVSDIFLSGETEVSYVAKDLVCAENLRVTTYSGGVLAVAWDTPAGYDVAQWTVRCMNESGYDETVKTEENTVSFEGIDEASGYTVDVTAESMSVNQRLVVSANSITVTDFTVDTARSDVLNLSWNANREIPAEGWTIRYSVDGVNAAQTISSNSNSAQVPVVPGGEYLFTILDGVGNAVLGGPFTHSQVDAGAFEGYSVTAEDLTVRLCKRPSGASWSYKDLSDDDYVNSFSVGQKVSVVIAVSGDTDTSDDDVLTAFAIYNEDGELVSFSHHTQTWRSMWYENYCELDIPAVPAELGTYNLVLYFNGMNAGSQKFVITS